MDLAALSATASAADVLEALEDREQDASHCSDIGSALATALLHRCGWRDAALVLRLLELGADADGIVGHTTPLYEAIMHDEDPDNGLRELANVADLTRAVGNSPDTQLLPLEFALAATLEQRIPLEQGARAVAVLVDMGASTGGHLSAMRQVLELLQHTDRAATHAARQLAAALHNAEEVAAVAS